MPVSKVLSRHERALQIIRRWRLLDDSFMKRCLKDNIPAVECILRIPWGIWCMISGALPQRTWCLRL